jgi:exodeoxyribonuclease VII small subunit
LRASFDGLRANGFFVDAKFSLAWVSLARRPLPWQTSDMATKRTDPAPSPVANFERSLDELERLVQKMELGEQSLDESLAAYERGVALYRQCQTALEQAELRVKLLSDPGKPENAEDFPTDAG